ncbi:DUF4160 domain-containing protein [Duganella qianjiadongensis]|uniref:DUF4160 domain-containing protein n=1 Tax=Duganella qianjiadongensis TaxID=2692176 RepID=A0ABW9VGC4_9BURK|nr:DUF4160 domain-containing protein [Duganella qianjiadongensis]
MPTVLTIFGLRVVIYPNDHRPAHVHVHVHVQGNGCEAVFNLHCPDGPPELRENYGFSQKELGKIVGALVRNLVELCAEWRARHGHY